MDFKIPSFTEYVKERNYTVNEFLLERFWSNGVDKLILIDDLIIKSIGFNSKNEHDRKRDFLKLLKTNNIEYQDYTYNEYIELVKEEEEEEEYPIPEKTKNISKKRFILMYIDDIKKALMICRSTNAVETRNQYIYIQQIKTEYDEFIRLIHKKREENILYIKDQNDKLITKMRQTDKFIDAISLCVYGGKKYIDYYNEYSKEKLENQENIEEVWISYKSIDHLINWIGYKFENHLYNLFTNFYRDSSVKYIENKPSIFSYTGYTNMNSCQVYVRELNRYSIDKVWNSSNSKIVINPDEYIIYKFGSQGEKTGRQNKHESYYINSILLDSIESYAYTYVEKKFDNYLKERNMLYHGKIIDSPTIHREFFIIRKSDIQKEMQDNYNNIIKKIQEFNINLVDKKDRDYELKKFEIETLSKERIEIKKMDFELEKLKILLEIEKEKTKQIKFK
jgi:MSV199 domain